MRIILSGAIWAALGLVVFCGTADAALNGMQQLVTGLNFPTYGTFAPGDRDRLFITEKPGVIKVLNLKSNTITGTFLTINDTDAANEGGLMGMAFHPGYNDPNSSGYQKFYVYVTVDNGNTTVPGSPNSASPFSTHIREYQVDPNNPDLALAGSKIEIMSFPRAGDNHVAGWIGFSPKDKYLYISSGDGGGADDNDAGHSAPLSSPPGNDAPGNAQDLTQNLMGKMLRIDVDHDDFNTLPRDQDTQNYAVPGTNPFVGVTDVRPEIWSYGLRNPFRDSFDRDTGDLWIADVGQSAREEVNFQPKTSTGGENYGWRLREGKIATPTPNPGTPVGGTLAGATEPIYDYTHGLGSTQGFAEIGGYVYRGPDPSLQGKYFFADEVSHHVWTLTQGPVTVTNIDSSLVPNVGALNAPSSFIEDAVGNLYLIDYSSTASNPPGGQGEVYRILTSQLLAGDYNADGYVDAADYSTWRDTLGSTTNLAADGDGSHTIDDGDYTVWLNNFGQTVHTMSPGSGGGGVVPEPATLVFVFQILAVAITMYAKARR